MMFEFDEEDLNYAAGYLDGEGCFHISSGRKIAVACETTHKPTILWLQKLFGGSVTHLTKKKKANWRPTYRWQVVARDALKVCQCLAPRLKEKQEQALMLIGFQQTMGPIGKPVAAWVKEQRAWFTSKVKEAKKRV